MTLYCKVEWGGDTRIQYTTNTKGGGGLCVCGRGGGHHNDITVAYITSTEHMLSEYSK